MSPLLDRLAFGKIDLLEHARHLALDRGRIQGLNGSNAGKYDRLVVLLHLRGDDRDRGRRARPAVGRDSAANIRQFLPSQARRRRRSARILSNRDASFSPMCGTRAEVQCGVARPKAISVLLAVRIWTSRPRPINPRRQRSYLRCGSARHWPHHDWNRLCGRRLALFVVIA